MKEFQNKHSIISNLRYDKFIYESTNSNNICVNSNTFSSIITRLVKINEIAQLVEPYLNNTFPTFKCKVANFRDNKLVIITTNSSAIRYFRIHKNEALKHINQLLTINSIKDIEIKISPYLSINTNILPN